MGKVQIFVSVVAPSDFVLLCRDRCRFMFAIGPGTNSNTGVEFLVSARYGDPIFPLIF